MRRWWKRVTLGLLAAFLLLGVGLGCTSPGRAAVKALLFVPQILPNAPVRPQEWFLGEPSRQEVRFPLGSRDGVGDLYLPARGGRHAGVVLFLGVNPAGRDDPRVINLGKGLARSGMAVLVPWSAPMAEKRVEPQEVDLLVGAFSYLRGLAQVDPARVGLGGFCVGASFAVLAAEDVRIRDAVAFVNFFGGYYDAEDLLVAIASRRRFYDSQVEPWEPDRLTSEVFTRHLIESVGREEERRLLEQLFLEGKSADGFDAASLSEEAKLVHQLLSGVTLEEARRLAGALPPRFREGLQRISPRTRIQDLKAPVLIMADREDALVPAAESRRLADALRPRGGVYQTEFSLFRHMDPTRRVSPPVFVKEVWKLLLHMYRIMRWAT